MTNYYYDDNDTLIDEAAAQRYEALRVLFSTRGSSLDEPLRLLAPRTHREMHESLAMRKALQRSCTQLAHACVAFGPGVLSRALDSARLTLRLLVLPTRIVELRMLLLHVNACIADDHPAQLRGWTARVLEAASALGADVRRCRAHIAEFYDVSAYAENGGGADIHALATDAETRLATGDAWSADADTRHAEIVDFIMTAWLPYADGVARAGMDVVLYADQLRSACTPGDAARVKAYADDALDQPTTDVWASRDSGVLHRILRVAARAVCDADAALRALWTHMGYAADAPATDVFCDLQTRAQLPEGHPRDLDVDDVRLLGQHAQQAFLAKRTVARVLYELSMRGDDLGRIQGITESPGVADASVAMVVVAADAIFPAADTPVSFAKLLARLAQYVRRTFHDMRDLYALFRNVYFASGPLEHELDRFMWGVTMTRLAGTVDNSKVMYRSILMGMSRPACA